MSQYITELDVSIDEADEQRLHSKGFKKIYVDLNKGAKGKYVYLWYKHGGGAVTRLQLSFSDQMAVGLINAGYTKIHRDLNAGSQGDYIYLWYFKGQTNHDTPIVGIDVTTDSEAEASKFIHGWERLGCDLNRKARGDWIYIWVKRERPTYICDVTVTNSFASDADYFNQGFIRVDEDTNRGAEGPYIFIWYHQTTDPKQALTDLQISTNAGEYQEYQQQNYQSVCTNLNEGTGGNQVYLWYKKYGHNKPIKAMTIIVNRDAAYAYERAGATVMRKDLNTGNKGSTEYLCVYQ